MAQDTAHARQHAERAHPKTGTKWPRTPHTGDNTTHGGRTRLNRSQGAQDIAHTTTGQRTERAHR